MQIAAPRSDHFDGKRFVNPGVDTDKTVGDLARWAFTGARAKWPRWAPNEHWPVPPSEVRAEEIAITYIGHATLLVRVAGCTLLTDPMFSQRASPFPWAGPKRVRSPGLALDSLPPVDIVLLSHNHYDHMDLPSLRRLQERWRPRIITGLGNGRYLNSKGVREGVELDWWDSYAAHPELTIHYVPAQHWSSRTPFDRRRMLWGGHVIESPAGRIFFAGDTGYGPHFRAIHDRFGPADVALLPIGAYEPRWFMRAQHMNPEDAVQAHLDLSATLSIAMHFGTFRLTDEGIDQPVRELKTALKREGVSPEAFRVPGFGETISRMHGLVRSAPAP